MGDIFVNKFDVYHAAHVASTPYALVSKLLPMVFSAQALSVCTVSGKNSTVKLHEPGVQAVIGKKNFIRLCGYIKKVTTCLHRV